MAQFLSFLLKSENPSQQTFCNFSQPPSPPPPHHLIVCFLVFFLSGGGGGGLVLQLGICVEVDADRLGITILPSLPIFRPFFLPTHNSLFNTSDSYLTSVCPYDIRLHYNLHQRSQHEKNRWHVTQLNSYRLIIYVLPPYKRRRTSKCAALWKMFFRTCSCSIDLAELVLWSC